MSRLAFQAGRTIQMQNSCSNEGKLLPPPRRKRSNLLLGVCLVRKWCHLGGHLFGFDQALHNNSSRVSHSEGNSMLLKPCIVLMFFHQDAWERDWCLHDYWVSPACNRFFVGRFYMDQKYFHALCVFQEVICIPVS